MSTPRTISWHGERTPVGCFVTRTLPSIGGTVREPLPMRFDLRDHSLTGPEWGYGGSGPAQLALAILADHLRDDARALDLYQAFKFGTIAGIQCNTWTLLAGDVERALELIASARALADAWPDDSTAGGDLDPTTPRNRG